MANNENKNAELALKAHKQRSNDAKSAETSEIKNMMGMTKTIKIAEGTPHEYSLTLRFPGVVRASEIEDIASNRFDNIVYTELMREAIKDVIISPKISSLDFWNNHAGYSEVSFKILNFLNQGLNGELN